MEFLNQPQRRVVLDNARSLEATVREILPYLRRERSARA